MSNKVLSYIHNGKDLSTTLIRSLDSELVRDIAAKAGRTTFQKDLATLALINGIGWFKPNCTDNPLFPNEGMTHSQRMKRLLKQSHQGPIKKLFWDSEFYFPQELVQVIYSLEETFSNGDILVSADINIAGERFDFAMHVDAQVEEYNREILHGLIDWKFPGAVVQDNELNDDYFFILDGSTCALELTFSMTGLISKVETRTR
ncbi:MAG: hypothetical protein ACRDAJ_11970 [Serratia fonticola]